jgi:hypothetical protein
MKDSTMILVLTAILAAAALPGIAQSLIRVAQAADAIEHIRYAAHSPKCLIMRASKVWRSL